MSKDLLADQNLDAEKVLNYANTKLGKAVVFVAGYVSVQEVFNDNYWGAAGFGAIALGFALTVHNDHSRLSRETIHFDQE